ncbi:MAG TPA: hypothetical protein VFQ74_04015 [Pseudolysinimonas sp.]|nr:hypothetical protein [Pseudolysinimonas sp.]
MTVLRALRPCWMPNPRSIARDAASTTERDDDPRVQARMALRDASTPRSSG